MTRCGDHHVQLEDELRTGDRDRPTAPTRIGLAESIANALEPRDLAICRDDFDGGDQELEVDALDLGLVRFFLVDWHLVPGPSVEDPDLFGPHPERGTRAVHRGEAAADNGDSGGYGRPQAEVDLFHESQAGHDAGQLFAGNTHLLRPLGAGGETDGIVLLPQLAERDTVRADLGAEADLDAELGEVPVDLSLADVPR